MGAKPGVPTLLEEAKAYIKQKYQKPGNVYLGIVSRLDAPVTGITLLARTSKAAARLSEAFRERKVEKTYLAVVAGEPNPPEQTLVHHLRKDERHRKVHVTNVDAENAQRAVLNFETLATAAEQSLLRVQLETGRKHQIRVQLAKIGCSIIGDQKYGSEVSFEPGIALHAWSLTIKHPVGGADLHLQAPVPQAWKKLRVPLDRIASAGRRLT